MTSQREWMTVPEIREATGATTRQLHYWIKRGWLKSTRAHNWDHALAPSEVRVARLMVLLTQLGFSTSRTVPLARKIGQADYAEVPLGYGFTLTYTDPDRTENGS